MPLWLILEPNSWVIPTFWGLNRRLSQRTHAKSSLLRDGQDFLWSPARLNNDTFHFFFILSLSGVNDFCSLDLFQPYHSDIESITKDLDCLHEKLDVGWLDYQKRTINGTDNQGTLFFEVADDWDDLDGSYHSKKFRFWNEETAECFAYCELCQFHITLL